MLKKALSLIFVLMLMTPAAVWLATGFLVETPPDPSDAGLPRPYGVSFFKNDYYRALDRYLNEHFIFRDRLVAVKNRIELKLFGRTGHPDVHVGRAGWLYPRTDIETFLQDHPDDAGSIAKLHLDLKALEKVVRASGRRFRFLVMPSKASIYPEYIGWVSLPAGGRYNAYDRFRAINRDDPLQSWRPLDGQLLDRKIGPHRLYEPADRYWNIHGAGVAADHLYQEIEEAVLSEPLKGPLKHTGNLEDLILNPVPSPSDRSMRRLAGYHAGGYGRTLAYGEGGLEPLVPYLQQMVQQLDIVPPDAIPNEAFGEDWRTYDSVLIQTTESEIQDLRIDLDPILDQLWDEVWPMDRMPLDLSAIKPISKIALQLGDRGLEIKSLGGQSRFALVVPGSYQRCFRILRLNLTALQPDTLSVSYPLTPSYVSKKALHPNRFSLYLPLPVHSRFALKFQPGSRAGLLILHQADIIGFPSGVDACGQKPLVARADLQAFKAPVRPDILDRPMSVAATPDGAVDAAGQASVAPLAPEAVVPKKPDVVEEKTIAKAALPETTDNPSMSKQEPEVNPPVQRVTNLTLHDIEEGRIFQRRNQKADIIVSGTYAGRVNGIEARVIGHDSGETILSWTTIENDTRGGVFLGLLTGVPQGGWYRLEVRVANEPGIVATGESRWGVGMLIGCIGQSNMKEWFYTGDDLEAHALLRHFDGNSWISLEGRGNGAIACGNRIIALAGIPVGLVEFAVNGSGLVRKADWGTGYWNDTRKGSIYRQFVAGVDETGGLLEFVLWIQGEADAARGVVTKEEYQAGLERLITQQVRRDIGNGSTRPLLPFLVVGMVKRPGGRNEPHQAIREAQRAVAETVAECFLAATTLDLTNEGKQHLAPEAYTIMGQRVSQTVLYVLGIVGHYRGPEVTGVRQIDHRILEVSLRHRGGTDIIPDTGITGWEIIDAEGSVPILKVFRQGPATLTILVERAPQGRAEVRYLYGALPDARRPLRDNASPRMPVEAYRDRLMVESPQSDKTIPEATTPSK